MSEKKWVEVEGVKSILGYVNGCEKKGVKIEGWRVKRIGNVLWLENEESRIRIKG